MKHFGFCMIRKIPLPEIKSDFAKIEIRLSLKFVADQTGLWKAMNNF